MWLLKKLGKRYLGGSAGFRMNRLIVVRCLKRLKLMICGR